MASGSSEGEIAGLDVETAVVNVRPDGVVRMVTVAVACGPIVQKQLLIKPA